MNREEVLEIFRQTGALLEGHFVLTSGRHSEKYINKDAIYPNTQKVAHLAWEIAIHFIPKRPAIQTVVGPAMGGIILSTWTAHGFEQAGQEWNDITVASVYAEKDGDKFVFRRGYDKFIRDRRVLVVEDIITTGGSVRKVIEAVRKTGGEVVAVAALCNRGNLTAEALGVPELYSLLDLDFQSWEEADCPLCREGVPVNTEVGKGCEFLARQGKM